MRRKQPTSTAAAAEIKRKVVEAKPSIHYYFPKIKTYKKNLRLLSKINIYRFSMIMWLSKYALSSKLYAFIIGRLKNYHPLLQHRLLRPVL
jgi:hypothetical protein